MKFEEVLPALREGKMIRRAEWSSSCKMFLYKDLIVVPSFDEGTVCPAEMYSEDLLADDWEVEE